MPPGSRAPAPGLQTRLWRASLSFKASSKTRFWCPRAMCPERKTSPRGNSTPLRRPSPPPRLGPSTAWAGRTKPTCLATSRSTWARIRASAGSSQTWPSPRPNRRRRTSSSPDPWTSRKPRSGSMTIMRSKAGKASKTSKASTWATPSTSMARSRSRNPTRVHRPRASCRRRPAPRPLSSPGIPLFRSRRNLRKTMFLSRSSRATRMRSRALRGKPLRRPVRPTRARPTPWRPLRSRIRSLGWSPSLISISSPIPIPSPSPRAGAAQPNPIETPSRSGPRMRIWASRSTSARLRSRSWPDRPRPSLWARPAPTPRAKRRNHPSLLRTPSPQPLRKGRPRPIPQSLKSKKGQGKKPRRATARSW